MVTGVDAVVVVGSGWILMVEEAMVVANVVARVETGVVATVVEMVEGRVFAAVDATVTGKDEEAMVVLSLCFPPLPETEPKSSNDASPWNFIALSFRNRHMLDEICTVFILN